MRQLLLTILSMVMVNAFAQTPQITVSRGSISTAVASGGTKTETFTITNTGNRDLSWNLKFAGAPVNFTKANYTESTQARAQDRITPNVWLTRNADNGLFNAFSETEFSGDGPADTEWAFGKSEDVSAADYTTWADAIDYSPEEMMGNVMSMHAISEDRYFDITFNSFVAGDGGGFSYTRVEQGLKWSSADYLSGVLIPGQSKTITVTFDASSLLSGFYTGNVVISSNDPVTAKKLVGLNVEVQPGNGTPEITVVNTKAFGTGFVNFATQRFITINNTGTAPLQITGVTSSQSFFVPEASVFTIAAGRGFDLPVMFMPTSVGNKAATLTLTTNDSDEGSFAISLSGTAEVAPSSSVDHFNYNVTVASGTTSVQNLVLANTGSADLTYSIEVNFPAATPFTFTKPDFSSGTLPENQDRITPDIRITSEDDYGIFNAASETSYDWDESPLGTTWSNKPTAEADYYGTWSDAIEDEDEMFMNKTLSMHIPDQNRYFDVTFTRFNCCENGGFSYVRTEVYNWLTADPAEGTITGGESATISLNINTRGYAVGQYHGTVVIRSNDPLTPARSIPVTLNVTGGPIASTHESSVDFGSTAVGNVSYQKVRVLNDGPDFLNVTGVTFTDNKFLPHEVTGTIAPFSQGVITISFTPTAVETLNGNITITTNDINNPTLQIPYTAQGIDSGEINVVADNLDAVVTTGTYETRSFTIQNTGNGPLNWKAKLLNNNPIVNFSKEANADWQLEANQDRINPKVWLTANTDELFNAAVEKAYDYQRSPVGTLWNYGTTLDSELDDYERWDYASDGWSDWIGGHTFSLRTGRVFFDVKFDSWTTTEEGATFSYQRQKANGWLKIDQSEGTIPAGESFVVTLTYDPGDYLPGQFNETLLIESDDTNEPVTEIPFQVTIQGIAEIDVLTDEVAFGNYGVNLTKTVPVKIKNNGTVPMEISSIASSNLAFTLSASNLTVPVDGEAVLNVKFKPTAVTSYTGTLQFTSNAENESGLIINVSGAGILVPDISVTPGEITYRTTTETLFTGNIDIKNSGVEPLNWAAGKASSYPLTHILEGLNQDYTQITALIPSKFDFAYDGGNSEISDGGYDMYDGGNILNTNLQSTIEYSDNAIISGESAFGANTKYFTRHLDGLFVLVADLNNVQSFNLEGNNGADGGGNADGATLSTVWNGTSYTGYVKRVFNNSDPSINELIIIETDAAVAHDYATYTNDGHHQLANLGNVKRVYYLLFAARTTSAVYVDDATVKSIMDKFLQVITGNGNGTLTNWLAIDQVNGTVNPGETQTIHYTADLSAQPDGEYSHTIVIGSNDPDESNVTIPVNINKGTIFVSNDMDDILVNEGFGTKTINFSEVFTDGNGNTLTYAVGSNLEIVAGTVDGTTLTLSERGTGTSIVSLRAEDTNHNVTYEDFNFRVNDVPSVITPIEPIVLTRGFETTTIEASTVFVDNDETDEVTLTVSSSNTAVVNAIIANGIIKLFEGAVGTSTITLTANDGIGGITSTTFVVTVNKASATFTASNAVATYDGTAKAVTITTSPENLSTSVTYKQNGIDVPSPVNAGVYEVTAMVNDANFEGTYTGTLTINKADQTITFDGIANVMNSNAPFHLAATSSSGLPVTFVKVSGPITVAGTLVTLTGEVGDATIEASQTGNANYNAATVVNRTFTIAQDPILSVDDPLQAHVQAYPVPAKEYLIISTGTYAMKSVTLTDAFGRAIYSAEPNATEHSVNTSNFSHGVYILKVVSEKGIVSRRIQVSN